MPIAAARRVAGALLAALLALPSCEADPLAQEVPSAAAPAVAPNWSAAAQKGIAAGEYAPEADGETLRATNRAQNLRAQLGVHGLTVTDRAGAGEVTLALRAWGRDDTTIPAEAAPPSPGDCLSGGAVDAFGDCLRRVEYARPGLTEWWENRPEGLEQGFTVTAPPDGEGALVFEIALGGAIVDLNGEEALLVRGSGESLRYGQLSAHDERGRVLPAWMEETDTGLRLVVDDSGAIGTVTVDPLLTTASWTAESDAPESEFGSSVASAGDVNGDGYGDVVVGAPGYSNGSTDEGRAYLYLGSASGLSTSAAWTAESDWYSGLFGSSVASAGDVNGDGYGDVVVGALGYNNGSPGEGAAYLYLGSATGLGTSAAWMVESDHEDAYFGCSVASAGDVNGDGYGDVVVGAYNHEIGLNHGGRAYLYLGSASGLATTEAWTVEGDQASTYLGYSVASAGDVNGDGYGDVVVGAPGYDDGSTDEGRAYVYLGSASGLATTAAWTAESDQDGAGFGGSVASAGDVNGDGYGDVLVGAGGYDDGGLVDAGRAYLYLGSTSGLATSAAWTVSSDQVHSAFGSEVASAGDVNGDGYGDVVAGASDYDGGSRDEGRAYVHLGSASGLATSEAWTAESDQDTAAFGRSVASAGDVNGDGYGDVVVGASYYDNGSTNEGRAYLYLGSSSGLSTSAAWTAESDQASAFFGISVASAGDVNGDGYGDVVVGADEYSNGSTSEGRAYLYLGSASGLASSAAWTVESDQTNARLGVSVASAGDVNGDGYGDVVVGAYAYDNGSTDEGRAYLYLGSPAGLPTDAAWTAEADQASTNFGFSVASAGDVNGDGYGDVVVGAEGYDGDSPNEGRAYVYLGSASGLATSAAWTAQSDQEDAQFGVSVGSAGDVNGDGYGDVVVGAEGYSNGRSREGRAYLYLGSASGLATSEAWTAESDQASASFGSSVGSAGDVNGDGYGDVVVGAYYFYDGSSRKGRAYLYLGSASGLATTAAWTAGGEQSSAYFGYSAASAGDVNGDGYGDIVVGSPEYGSDYEGRAYLYLGNGADGTAPLALPSQARQPGLTTPIVAGLTSTSGSEFDVVLMNARGAWGRSNVKVQVEAKALGAAFDGTGLQTQASYTSSGLTGASIQQVVSGLTGSTGYHWRARVFASPAEGRPQGWGPWRYGGLSGDSQGGHVFTASTTLSYADTDGDGYGDATASVPSRGETPPGYVENASDCVDTDAAIHPGATEVCDPSDVDEDCNGVADNDDSGATGTTTFYADDDSDGYGGVTTGVDCDPPSGSVATSTDCDDADAAINPEATEAPGDGVDEDCDGTESCYVDEDGDGYRPDAITTVASADADCADPGEAPVSAPEGDCDDTSVAYHPDALEGDCTDPNDYNCDGSTGFADADGDGSAACEDCDDRDASVYPGAPESTGGIDNDCDGTARCYVDADGDGYRPDAASTMESTDGDCVDPGEAVASAPVGDCDDTSVAYHPAAPEGDCTDPNDYNCDGSTGFADADADGWAACADCDDAHGAVHPGAVEVCNTIDDDCDGTVDIDAVDALPWYADADADGFTDPDTTLTGCEPPDGYLAESSDDDCDDGDATTFPGAPDIPDDGVDQDCDGIDATAHDTADSGSPGETGSPKDPGACGCASTNGPRTAWSMLVGVLVPALRRRRPRPTPTGSETAARAPAGSTAAR